MTQDVLLQMYADSGRQVAQSVAGIPDPRLADQPSGIRNHPAWTLAHLCAAGDLIPLLLGQPTIAPEEWGRNALPGSIPVADRSAYPPLDEMLDVLRRQHAAVEQMVRNASPDVFAKEPPEQFRFAPTIGHITAYMLATHEPYHTAQILAWRRVAGFAAD